MNVRKSIVATIVITFLSGLLIFVALSAPIHELIFHFIPADGPVSILDRASLDNGVVNYYFTGHQSWLSGFTQNEQQHLADARIRFIALAILAFIGAVILILKRPKIIEWQWAATATISVALISSIAFEPLFILLHELIFPGGNWYLPSDQYVITQIYPLNFFISCWAIVSLGSWGLLFALGKRKLE